MALFDFYFYEAKKGKKDKEDNKNRAVIRRGEEVILRLQTASNTIEGWRQAWEEELNTSSNRDMEWMNELDIIEDNEGAFASWSDRYIWLKIVIAYSLKTGKDFFKGVDYVSFFQRGLDQIDKENENKEEGKAEKEDEGFKNVLWADMQPIGELYALMGKGRTGGLPAWAIPFIKRSLQELGEHPDLETQQRYLLQLYGTGLVMAENTRDFVLFSRGIFELDDRYLSLQEKQRMLSWAVEKNIQVDATPIKNHEPSQKDSRRPPSASSPEHHPTLIHIIADQYLRHYDLENALAFWQKLSNQPLSLRLLLKLYSGNSPYVFFGVVLVVLLLLGYEVALQPPLAAVLAMAWAGVFAVVLLGFLGYILIDFLRRGGFVFGHLFMQRLIGASIVGLAVIALTPEGWQMGLYPQSGNWALVTLGGFFLAWFFLFFKIYQERARTGYFLDRMEEESDEKSKWDIIQRHITSLLKSVSLDQRQRFKKDIFGISVKVLFIHALLTVVIAFLVSGFLFHVFHEILTISDSKLITDHTIKQLPWGSICRIDVDPDHKTVAIEFVGNSFSFGFSPKLILMWSSVGLLLGAFAQLIWDDTVLASV